VRPSAGSGAILALDVGQVRVGLALANRVARIAHPAGAILREDALGQIAERCKQERVDQLIIGLPRGMDGQETAQTIAVRQFGTDLAARLNLPCAWQDEALTSVQAEAELKKRGKPYAKADIDALAATYILEDYIRENI